MRLRNQVYSGNIDRRGRVPASLTVSLTQKSKDESLAVGPVMLAFFLVVVVGSALFQILQTARSA